jgi:hypothetical protein
MILPPSLTELNAKMEYFSTITAGKMMNTAMKEDEKDMVKFLKSRFVVMTGYVFVLILCIIPICTTRAAEPIVWDFETEKTTWKSQSKTITLSNVEDVTATVGSSASLRINGFTESGTNYAVTNHQRIAARQYYRLSAWVRIERTGPSMVIPILKCEFFADDLKHKLGQATTESYDGYRTGTWQRLSGEFRVPEGTGLVSVALDRGFKAPSDQKAHTEIDAYIDDVTIEPIERLNISGKYRLLPFPSPLKKMRGVHPRIYLTDTRITELREAIKTTHAPFWDEVRARADRAVKSGPPAYHDDVQLRFPGDEGIGGFQQLWQRGVGDTMPILAMAYVLTGEQRYLDSAREWALASCGYSTWGLGWLDGVELAAAHQLFGLGIVYDWCYDGLGEEARRTIRETLIQKTTTLFQATASEKKWWPRTELHKLVWGNWYNAYLSNHQWIPMCGMAVSGLAVFDEVEEASEWIALSLDKFKNVMSALGPDGASHEGASYFGYGVEYLLKFMYISRELLDENMFDTEWFRNTATYRQYLALPRNAWTARNNVVDIGDSGRGNGPDYQLRGLAMEYRDGYAQWLAQQICEAKFPYSIARWLNLIWFDPTLEPKPPYDRPTLHHFKDMGIVSARSGWSGDESLIVLKCGPYMGHEALKEKVLHELINDADDQHVHPDANHFVLFGSGEWLIRDDGGHRSKWTDQHNTLIINGKGQLGEGWWYFNGLEPLLLKSRPRIINASSTPELDRITGNAAEAYPGDIGLRKYIRHLLFLKPDILIVADDIVLDDVGELELRFHPEQQKVKRDGTAFLTRGKQAEMRLEPLTGGGVKTSAEFIRGEGWHAMPDSLFTIRLQTKKARWRNAVALSWSKAGQEPVKVKLFEDGNTWRFIAKDRTVILDWTTGEAKFRR